MVTTPAFLTVPQEAISMERRAEPHHVPQNAIERIVRQMLEHGRPADLLFDESVSRGSAFVSFVLKNAPSIEAGEPMRVKLVYPRGSPTP
jgi:hypothetical protein